MALLVADLPDLHGVMRAGDAGILHIPNRSRGERKLRPRWIIIDLQHKDVQVGKMTVGHDIYWNEHQLVARKLVTYSRLCTKVALSRNAVNQKINY
jgi:hypothetical protein